MATAPALASDNFAPDDFALNKVNVAMTPRERFAEFLQTRGKRSTRQRQMIVEHVSSHHEHFDADQLLAELRSTPEGARASRPTVYRTLTEMVEAGLLKKMVLGGRAIYEHDYGYPQHDHFICEKCQQLVEFRNEEISAVLERVAADHGFRMSGHRLEVHGICAECAKPPSRRHRKLDMI